MAYSVYISGVKTNIFLSNTLLSIIVNSKVDINKIPFVSTYFYNGKLNLNESIAIEYYVTDALQSEVTLGKAIKTFDIEVCIGQGQSIISTHNYTNILAGDNSVIIPLQLPIGDYWYSIQATDQQGRKSVLLYNDFMVYDKTAYESAIATNVYTVTASDLATYNISNTGDYGSSILVTIPDGTSDVYAYLQSYAENVPVESNKYICFLADTNADGHPEYKVQNWFRWTVGDYHSYVKYGSSYDANAVELESQNNLNGLQSLLDSKIADGYNKVILPSGTYRISADGYISVEADNFVLDCSGCTFKSNGIKSTSNFHIMSLYGYNSKIMNANFEGCLWETDYSIWKDEDSARSYYELGSGFSQAVNSKYSGFENCTVKHITGYGIMGGTTPKNTDPVYDVSNFKWNNKFRLMPVLSDETLWKPLDIVDGVAVNSDCRLTYDSFIDISFCANSPVIAINKFGGYSDRAGGDWNLTVHFYDSNKNYISSSVSTQFRDIVLPKNTVYIKVTAHTNQVKYADGESSKNDTNCLTHLKICTPYRISNCYLKDIEVDDVRCVGMCPYGKNCYSDNLTIVRSGFAEAHQLVDAEDTWENLQEYTFKNCVINKGISNSYVLFCSGLNTTVESSTIDISSYDRPRHMCIRNCNIGYFSVEVTSWLRSGYTRVQGNNFYNSNAGGNGFPSSVGCYTYDQASYDRKLIIDNNNTFAVGLIGIDRGKHILFKDITFDANNRTVLSTVLGFYKNCTVKNISNGFAGCVAENCTFINCRGELRDKYNTYAYDLKFTNCTFINCNLTYNGALTEEELFINCIFTTE